MNAVIRKMEIIIQGAFKSYRRTQGVMNMQALMLAAGMGCRMGDCAGALAKCMIRINGQTLLERTVEALEPAGISKMVIVVGWHSTQLIKTIQSSVSGIELEFVCNSDYAATNNIYSLYLAREQLGNDDTILIESDMVFDKELLKAVAQHPAKDIAVVSKYKPWMNGTVVTVTEDGKISAFIEKQDIEPQNADIYYKTVNIYKFSRRFLQQSYIPGMEEYIRAHGKNQYYEMVLKELTEAGRLRLNAFITDELKWYEIDTKEDLERAASIFQGMEQGEK